MIFYFFMVFNHQYIIEMVEESFGSGFESNMFMRRTTVIPASTKPRDTI